MIGRRENYFIKEGYEVRTENQFFDDTPFEDEFQKPVYEYATDLALRKGYRSVIDLGCGSGFKLMKYFRHLETIGIDLPQTVDFLVKKYPDRRWEVFSPSLPLPSYDLVICADVIEHLLHPEALLDYISLLGPRSIVISTPDRDRLEKGIIDGPPRNIHHVREWNSEEFNAFVSDRFYVEAHLIEDNATQLVELRSY